MLRRLVGSPATWLGEPTIERYFGRAQTLDQLIERSSLMQGEGYKAVFEEARRQKPYCAMALNWCFDEPWPAAANNSLVAYPSVPKPALDQVRRACRPLCASARIAKFDWTEGELFEAEVWLLNDRFAAAGPFSFTVTAPGCRTDRRDTPLGKPCRRAEPATSQAPRRARHSRHGTQTVSGSKSPSKAIRKWMPATRWPTAAPPANRRARHR